MRSRYVASTFVLAALAIGSAPPAAAQSEGPNVPLVVVDDPATGTKPWTAPEEAAVSDNVEAIANDLTGALSHYLKATGFGFSIPSGATIGGIQVALERRGASTWDAQARIVKNGAIGTTDRSYLGGYPAGQWNIAETVITYGGPGDLWGETWTAADINAADFGFALSAFMADGIALVDSIAITVFYGECGNGQIGMGEQCEPPLSACCSSACQFEASGTPCPDGSVCNGDEACDGGGDCIAGSPLDCDDGSVCTEDLCDPTGGCLHDPELAVSCRSAAKSTLTVRRGSPDTRDKLVWKWLKGAQTSLDDLGLPTGTTNYTLCVYSGTGAAEVLLPGGPSWRIAGTKGFKYSDPDTVPDGARRAVLKSGAAGKAKALVKGKGSNLPDAPTLPLALPVIAQLVNDANGTCFEASYDAPTLNDSERFKAKSP